MRTLQILGAGCPKCRKLAENAEAAVRELGIPCAVEKVTDIEKIVESGVLATPALVIDGAVRAVGRVPSVDQIKAMLK
jgi:small redox-active disulfide protein 2